MNNLIFGVELIKSKSNSTISEISKLLNKKYRLQRKQFICDGIKLFEEAVEFGAKIRHIILDNSVEFSYDVIEKIKKCEQNGTKIICVESYIFDKLTAENAPQGVISVCDFFEKRHIFSAIAENELVAHKTVIALESVRDPGNLGTICRNAVALGVDVLILSNDCADIYSPKVIRASMGAIFKLDIVVVDDLPGTIEKIKKSGRRVLAAALNDNSLVLGKDKITNNDVVVLGNEGHGISIAVMEQCTDTVFIPMRKNTESLNVAIAAAIIMWEISK